MPWLFSSVLGRLLSSAVLREWLAFFGYHTFFNLKTLVAECLIGPGPLAMSQHLSLKTCFVGLSADVVLWVVCNMRFASVTLKDLTLSALKLLCNPLETSSFFLFFLHTLSGIPCMHHLLKWVSELENLPCKKPFLVVHRDKVMLRSRSSFLPKVLSLAHPLFFCSFGLPKGKLSVCDWSCEICPP